MADAANPAVHITFAVGRQKIDPLRCANVEHVGVALLAAFYCQPRINLNFHQTAKQQLFPCNSPQLIQKKNETQHYKSTWFKTELVFKNILITNDCNALI